MSRSDGSGPLLSRDDLIDRYGRVIRKVEALALSDNVRAYGGVVRSEKGKLVETLALHIVRHAWQSIGGSPGRLSFSDVKSCRIPIADEYVDGLPHDVGEYIRRTKNAHYYKAQVDVHAFIDGEFVLGVECKSYTENAMLKRILVDFRLLKSLYPNLVCCLLQLESMLGGMYSRPLASPQLGSPRTHTLMSHFPDVALHIVTLLEGDRKVEQPIHKPDFFKPLPIESLNNAIKRFAKLFKPFVASS